MHGTIQCHTVTVMHGTIQCHTVTAMYGTIQCHTVTVMYGTIQCHTVIVKCGPGSSVCIATGYGQDVSGIESRWGQLLKSHLNDDHTLLSNMIFNTFFENTAPPLPSHIKQNPQPPNLAAVNMEPTPRPHAGNG
jgi:hypothetical protein